MADLLKSSQEIVQIEYSEFGLLKNSQTFVQVEYADPAEADILLPTYNNKKRITNHTNLRR